MKRLLVLVALFTLPLHAAEEGALSLSPAVVTLRGDYGQSTTQTLKLINGTSRPFSFDLVAQDVLVSDGKRLFADAGTVSGSVAATAVFSQKHVDVPPGETVAVTVTVTLPPSTPVRAVVALFRGTNHIMSGRVPMSASLGTLLTFTVSDSIDMGAGPLTLQPQTATANLGAAHDCTNTGHEPLVAKGVLAVLDAQGKLVGKAAMKPHRLLPGESARLGTEYSGELAPGRYRVLLTYDYEGRTLVRSADVEVH